MKIRFLWIPAIYGLTLMVILNGCSSPQTSSSLADNRLDPNTHPTFQQIELFLDPSQTTYSGEVNIDLNIKQLTSSFRYHAQEMELTSIMLTHNLDTIPVTTTQGPENIVMARTQTVLSPGEYHLKISFQKDFNQQTVGLYRVAYEGNNYLFTMLEAVDARRAFPCWDEPQYKIPWQLTLNIPNEQLAISNTPIASTRTTASGQQIVFKRTKPLPSYLILSVLLWDPLIICHWKIYQCQEVSILLKGKVTLPLWRPAQRPLSWMHWKAISKFPTLLKNWILLPYLNSGQVVWKMPP